MKSLCFAIAPLALALTQPGAAMAHSDQPAIAASSTLLTLSVEGKSTRKPDLAVFSAGVTTQGTTASEAMSANAAAMTRVVATLKKAGIADSDIQTSQISLNPVYGQPVMDRNGQVTQEPRIIGYQATNQVTVRSRDVKGFGKVLDALVGSGANQINGPSFQLDDLAGAMDEARTRAMKAARARADLYAKAAGLRVVRIVSISESSGYAAQPVYARAAMADAAPLAVTPVEAGEVEAQVNLTIQFELAP
ncbi:MAG: SIMPL domain-containing protein [Novosphingobium sp.]